MTDSLDTLDEMKPSAARLVESLRDTGYIFTTSVADIVDNSVSADADQIEIILQTDFGNNPSLWIADNGNGMDEAALEAAMIYGSPLRPSPKSLGKFGMGLKTASTSFCRKLTVISKKDNQLSIRQWDLDTIKKLDKWILLRPEMEDYEEEVAFLNKVTVGKNGTIVIWESIDRLVRSTGDGSLKKQLDKIEQELREHLSGVFFNFLSGSSGNPKIEIFVNKTPLEPWDPFCRWLNDDGAKRVEIHENKPFQITEMKDGEEEVIGEFYVNIYILPTKSELNTEEEKKARYGLDNQGFHVFREGRMIYSGGWPHRLFVKDPHLNLIRVELLFDHKLDHYFQIDIKKSRIDLPKDLREHLKKVIAPARNEANRRYRVGTAGKVKNNNELLNEQHAKSSTAIEKHHASATSGSVVNNIDTSSGEAEIKNKFGTTRVKLQFDFEDSRVIETKENLTDGVLWSPGLVDGNRHAVFINQSHEFYKKFYLANKDNSALIIAMDSLLWSLAEAELSVMSDTVKRNLEDMRVSVSRSLRTLAEELPEIKEELNYESTESIE
ncbi:ATP-binding protein [Kaistella pullorum]|uniref:ATP-binding protein n=1 Tax=Kaistella pullorum TaxID=2763074 RepID=A0ABR8WLG6_9FLAO|nr:ATP-binding protein [Kaistella pullorum]MBD8017793.1 ATP-binding protein [Kaistella pullorum]